jgi:predicted O-methyltransferase YrrM
VKYKFYFRKSSFKKDLKNGNFLLNLISEFKPKNVLEIGVLEGATSRNICELLYKEYKENFNFIGIDLFGDGLKENNPKEFTPISYKINNPFKWIYFKLILRMRPNSKECVEFLLRKFKNSVNIFKGYSKDILKKMDLSHIDFVFVDGGHSYETVSEDLNLLISKLKKNSIIICDDYNIKHYGVRRAVNEVKNFHEFEDHERFALLKIKK